MAEKKAVAMDAMPADAVNNADAVNTQAGEATKADTTATSTDAVSNADATNNDEATNADTVAEAPVADITAEKAPKGDTSEMVVYAVDSTAVRIGDEYFYASDWTITIPASLAEQAEAMGLQKVEA